MDLDIISQHHSKILSLLNPKDDTFTKFLKLTEKSLEDLQLPAKLNPKSIISKLEQILLEEPTEVKRATIPDAHLFSNSQLKKLKLI